MLRLSELKGSNENLLLVFLRELERRGMIHSNLEPTEDGKSTERVWHGYETLSLSQEDLELIEDMFFVVVSKEDLEKNFNDRCRIWKILLQSSAPSSQKEKQK